MPLPVPVCDAAPRSGLLQSGLCQSGRIGSATEVLARSHRAGRPHGLAEASRALARRARETGPPCARATTSWWPASAGCSSSRTQVLSESGTAGWALDLTGTEEDLRDQLARHIDAHAEVLENLASAIAIYGPTCASSSSTAPTPGSGGVDEDRLLTGEPHLTTTSGDDARAPAPARAARLPGLQARAVEALQHPDRAAGGAAAPARRLDLRMTVTPHPFGGVLFTFEDVTDRLALERSYNTLIAVQRETLDNLYEGVAVYGADGRLEAATIRPLRGSGSCRVELLHAEPHARDVVLLTRAFFDVPDDDWPEFMMSTAWCRSPSRREQRRPGGARRRLGRRLGPGAPARRRLALHLPGRHRFDPGRAGTARAQRGAGDHRPAEVGVSGQHLLRAAHAAQRHRRLRRDSREQVLRRAQRASARVQPGDRRIVPAPAGPDQRHSRPGDHRGGLPAARPGAGRS